MKRQLFTVLVCMTVFAVTSCGEKKGKDKFEERIEKPKNRLKMWWMMPKIKLRIKPMRLGKPWIKLKAR